MLSWAALREVSCKRIVTSSNTTISWSNKSNRCFNVRKSIREVYWQVKRRLESWSISTTIYRLSCKHFSVKLLPKLNEYKELLKRKEYRFVTIFLCSHDLLRKRRGKIHNFVLKLNPQSTTTYRVWRLGWQTWQDKEIFTRFAHKSNLNYFRLFPQTTKRCSFRDNQSLQRKTRLKMPVVFKMKRTTCLRPTFLLLY